MLERCKLYHSNIHSSTQKISKSLQLEQGEAYFLPPTQSTRGELNRDKILEYIEEKICSTSYTSLQQIFKNQISLCVKCLS